MLRTALMMFALAGSAMTSMVGCIDDDGPVDDGPQKSGEDDPDLDDPNDVPADHSGDCHALTDDEEDQPACTPK